MEWYLTMKLSNPDRMFWSCLEVTSWSLLGPGVEVGLVPNIMKCINIFIANVIKDSPYNYDKIIQVLWKKGNKKKKNFTLKVFEMMPHGTLKFQIVFWALRPTSTNNAGFIIYHKKSAPNIFK